MKTDIQIAQEAVLEPVTLVAERAGIPQEELELYGKYKAKVSDDYIRRLQDRPEGKLILVTAINPTPAGEGKTTVTVGLGEAFGQLGKKAVIALREPSLGPCFGIKGGAAGGGYAQVVPMEDLNLTTPSILAPMPTTMLRSTRSFISMQRFHTTCRVSIPSSLPCWIWLSSSAASRLLALVMA